MVLHYVLAIYCVSDNSYFNELNEYDDTEKGNWRRRGVGEVLAAVQTLFCATTTSVMQP